jgi:hypothetical protein
MSYYKILHIPTGLIVKETTMFYLDNIGSTYDDKLDTFSSIIEQLPGNLKTLNFIAGPFPTMPSFHDCPCETSEFEQLVLNIPVIDTTEDTIADIYESDQINCLYHNQTTFEGPII